MKTNDFTEQRYFESENEPLNIIHRLEEVHIG